MSETDSPDPRDDTGHESAGASAQVRRRRSRPEAAEKVPARKRVTFWLGLGLIAAGVAVLGWVAWQFWGTNWQSHRKQDQVSSAIQDGWGQGEDVVRTKFGNASAILHVPRFGSDYAVPVLEGSTPDVLAAGIGHMEDTATAGDAGNYALAAHRVTHGEPFAKFPELRAGDKVYVETRAATYTYVLDTGGEDLIIPFSETWVLDPEPTNPKQGGVQPPTGVGDHLLTLLTCSEIFHTDNRSIVFGHLVETTPTKR